jgi:hypothetical protein
MADVTDTHTEFIVAWTTLPETRKDTPLTLDDRRSGASNQNLKMKFVANLLNSFAQMHFLAFCDAIGVWSSEAEATWLRL